MERSKRWRLITACRDSRERPDCVAVERYVENQPPEIQTPAASRGRNPDPGHFSPLDRAPPPCVGHKSQINLSKTIQPTQPKACIRPRAMSVPGNTDTEASSVYAFRVHEWHFGLWMVV